MAALAGRRRVFASVFHTTHPSEPSARRSRSADQARFDRSWHVVTSQIALPGPISTHEICVPRADGQDAVQHSSSFRAALDDVLHPSTRCRLAVHTPYVLDWHMQQVRQHFLSHVLPVLLICDDYADELQVLAGSIHTLEAAYRQYLSGLSLLLRGMEADRAEQAQTKFRRDLHAIVGNAMSPSLTNALRRALSRLMSTVLDGAMAESDERDKARVEILRLVESLRNVGMAGEKFQILFAELLDGLMVTYVHDSFSGVWASHGADRMATSDEPRCVAQLSNWIREHYARLAIEVTAHIGNISVSEPDVKRWTEIAVGRLAALRISELFDIVSHWPDSECAVHDLRVSVTTPQRRLQLTDAFSAALKTRLLHPGRSTLDILRTYIHMIRAFHQLDHSRVLLDRVAYPLQLYLCTREDTVRTIITGLLAEQADLKPGSSARETKLVELVDLLYDPVQERAKRQDEDWDDINWIPPPVDAGHNYKRHESEDVVGTLIGTLGSAEGFIQEFQNIMGERLLSAGPASQDDKVLRLLKKRFGESSMQACDVMMKDVLDSSRLDSVIHSDATHRLAINKRDWIIRAIILSRLFWPDMGHEAFLVPPRVASMQKSYEACFQQVKPARKLKWLNHLGKATVELELEDRKITEVVRTHEATVIDAFSDEVLNGRAGWSSEALSTELKMDEDLVLAALNFWEKKFVLRRPGNGYEYVVVERLRDFDAATTAPVLPPLSAPRKPKSADSEKERERRQVYWQFIVGMLTNSSPAMPLGQIAMMMKMLMTDGFPWGNEELQEFLGNKVSEGKLELTGGKYKLKK